jgi:hypothetical protein
MSPCSWQIQKSQRAPEICGGTLIQKRRGVAAQTVAVGLLGQKAVDRKKVAEDASAARRRFAPGGNVFGCLLALSDSREQAKLEGGFQCFGFLEAFAVSKNNCGEGGGPTCASDMA